MLGRAAALGGGAGFGRHGGAGEGLLQDDVDHTCHSVGTVGCRCAVFQDFNAFNGVERDVRYVDEGTLAVIRERIRSHAVAVDQDQGRCSRQTVQGDAACTGSEGLGETLAQGTLTVGSDVLQHLRDRRVAGLLQVVGSDDLHRAGDFCIGAADVGTRDFNALNRARGGIGRCLGHGRNRGNHRQSTAGDHLRDCQRQHFEFKRHATLLWVKILFLLPPPFEQHTDTHQKFICYNISASYPVGYFGHKYSVHKIFLKSEWNHSTGGKSILLLQGAKIQQDYS